MDQHSRQLIANAGGVEIEIRTSLAAANVLGDVMREVRPIYTENN